MHPRVESVTSAKILSELTAPTIALLQNIDNRHSCSISRTHVRLKSVPNSAAHFACTRFFKDICKTYVTKIMLKYSCVINIIMFCGDINSIHKDDD